MRQQRILIVDDHADTAACYARLCQEMGWESHCASSIAEAIGALRRLPDCLILDLRLSDGDGETFLGLLRELVPSTGVVVLTGVSDPERLRILRDLYKPAAVLRKPATPEEVLDACARALSG